MLGSAPLPAVPEHGAAEGGTARRQADAIFFVGEIAFSYALTAVELDAPVAGQLANNTTLAGQRGAQALHGGGPRHVTAVRGTSRAHLSAAHYFFMAPVIAHTPAALQLPPLLPRVP